MDIWTGRMNFDVKFFQTFKLFQHQIGGHGHNGEDRFIASYNDSVMLKPKMGNKSAFAREAEFYERLEKSSQKITFFAKYYGIYWLKKLSVDGLSSFALADINDNEAYPCIALENITAKFNRPSCIDIKIGTQTYEPSATNEKIMYERSKFPFQEEIGFRVTGFKVFDAEVQKYRYFDKNFCRKLNPYKDLSFWISAYFFNGRKFRLGVIKNVIMKVQHIAKWMESQQDYNFYASSLLFVYGGGDDEKKNDSAESDNDLCDVRLIDFGHVHYISPPTCEKDHGCSVGLNQLCKYLQQIHDSLCNESEVEKLRKDTLENFKKYGDKTIDEPRN